MSRILATLVVVLLLRPVPAESFEVFQDPTNTGNPNQGALVIDPSSTEQVNLNLYIHRDGVAADPNSACSGAGLDEYCGWDLHIAATGGVSLGAFLPEPKICAGGSNDGLLCQSDAGCPGGSCPDIVFNRTAAELRANGGDPLLGRVGTHRIGTLTLQPGGGSVDVVGNLYVSSALQTQAIPSTPLALGDLCGANGDTDGDTLCDNLDPCKHFANTLPLVISNFVGIPDECFCGDFDNNHTLTGGDSQAINQCAGFVRFDCDLTRDDVDGNGVLTGNDAARVNRVAGFLDPAYLLTCSRRPEATCGGETGVACF